MITLRRLARQAFALLAGILLVVTLALGLAQTSLGKRWLAATLSAALSDDHERAVVTGIGGFVPFDTTIARIAIIDAQGLRVRIERVAFALAPRDLLAGRLRFTRLAVGGVALARRGSGASNLAALLHPPLPLRIEHATIDSLTLGRDLIGERVVAAVTASLSVDQGTASVDLALRRIDGTDGEVKLHAAVDNAPAQLELSGDIAEPSGRLLSRWLGRPEPLPLAVHLAGAGPLADWRGSLAARAGAEATLDATLEVSGNDVHRLGVAGEARLGPLLSPPLAGLAGERTRFDAAARLIEATLAIDNLSATAAAGTVRAAGYHNFTSGAFDGTAVIETPDLTRLAPLLGNRTLTGAARTTLSLGGDPTGWWARLSIDAARLALDVGEAQAAQATIDLGASGAPDAATPIALSGSGSIEGVRLAQGPPPGRLGERLDWRGSAQYDRAAARIDVKELALSSAGSTLTAAFGAGATGVAGAAHLVVPDITSLTDAKVRGGLALDADFHAGSAGSAVVVLSGAIRDPDVGVQELDRLLGPAVTLAGTLSRDADGTLAATDVRIAGAQLALAGAAAQRTDGTSSAEATLSGERLAAGRVQLDRLEARIALADLRQPKARIAAQFKTQGIDGTANAELFFVPGETLRLTELHLAAAKTRLDGEVALDLAQSRLDGTITASAPDLRPWSAVLGIRLGGSAELKATLQGETKQSVEARIAIRNLRLGERSARRVDVTLRLADPLGAPTGRGTATIEKVAAGAAIVDHLSIAGTSERPGRFALKLQTQGKLGDRFALDGAAILTLHPPGGELGLTRLVGTVGSESVQLRRVLRLTANDGRLAFADLDLALGKGAISGAGAIKSGALSLQLRGKSLPVRMLAEIAAHRAVGGVLGFEATFSGTRAQPRGELIVDAEQLRFAAADRQDSPLLGLVALARWHDEVVEFRGRLAGPGTAALGFSGKAPLRLERRSWALILPPEGALALRLEGEGELASVADMLPVGEGRLAGHFAIDIGVDGTVAAPRAGGKLSIRNGRYESLLWGTTFAGIGFDLVGNRDRLVLQRFTASDGGNGTASLEGTLDLAASPSFHITGTFARFRAVARDEATATMSGSVGLTGTLLAPRVSARLTIDRAELRVPERPPANLRPIPVTIVDSAKGEVLATPNQSPESAALLALELDVAISVPGQTFVRGRGLDSEWRGQLRVTGTTASPRILGKLEVVRGTYAFLGKSANLSSGAITFLGGTRIDPAIDIEARASSTDITAIIHITGTATAPSIRLTSQPELPQDEILARVLFGTGIGKVNAAQAIEIAQAGAALAQGGDVGLLERVRQGLGLDRLMFGSSPTATPYEAIATPSTPAGVANVFAPGAAASGVAAQGGSSAVSAGKYVAQGVYVGVSQGLGAGSSKLDVQIDVTRHISVDTSAGQQSGTGIGLNWKLDY